MSAPAVSTPVAPPPTTTKVGAPPSIVLGMGVGRLQAAEDVVAQPAGVAQGVEGSGVLGGAGDAEEAGRGPGPHDQMVVGEGGAVGERHPPRLEIDRATRPWRKTTLWSRRKMVRTG